MEALKEISIPMNALPKMVKIQDLIYFDGPLLSHFESIYKENYLYYWVDSDDKFNRWLVFRTTNELLDKYLKKEISLFKLISNPEIGVFFKLDIDGELNYKNLAFVNFTDLPESYIPNENSYYNFKPIGSRAELEAISDKVESGVLQAYYNESSKIGKGTIDLEVLAPSLNDFANINKGLRKVFIDSERLKFKKDIPRYSKKPEHKFDYSKYLNATQFNYFGNTSRSFGALFKTSSDSDESIEKSYIEFLMHFFEYSSDPNKHVEFIKNMDRRVLESFKGLLATINSNKIQFNINYENSKSNLSSSKKISYREAGEILDKIEYLQEDDVIDIKLEGRFTALNIRTGSYQFESLEADSQLLILSNGYLDSDRKEMAWKIKWDKHYKVVVERKQVKRLGRKKPKIVDLLVSFTEIDK